VARIDRTPPALFAAGSGDPVRERLTGLTFTASRRMVRLSEALLRLPHWRKLVIMVTADGIMLPVALLGALAVHSDGRISLNPADSIWLITLVPIITIPIFACLGLYRTVIRYIGEQAFLAVVPAVLLSAIVLVGLILITGTGGVSITAAFAYSVLALLLIGGSRLAMRIYFCAATGKERKRVVVYGAGASGVQLVKALAFSKEYRPVAFIDDDKALQRRVVHGLLVYGPRQLCMLIPKLGFSHVFLAMPCISQARRAEILASLDALPVHVKTVPSLSELLSGAASFQDIREVDVEEVLGRKSVPPDETLLDACVRDRVVMVTGAGGSIGSQLCRQVLRLGAKQLILFEQSEFQLYQVEMELTAALRREGLDVALIALLGSVQDHTRLENVMKHFKVETIYHAAAYKHVPLVEHNMIEGAQNNVLGSWHVATAAVAAGVETCVLISTDKAVRPISVMGASKRLAELIFQGMAAKAMGPRFCIVRLGNVVGSSGSVVPLFRDQLRRGGPLTVTDPTATRYFMTVSEAAELIIQAGSMGSGGEIFVLDMGEPVRIDDLARRMIRLAGLDVKDPHNPNGDIAIEYIGLRPGEKLHEELVIGNKVEPTAHPKIICAKEGCPPPEQIHSLLQILIDLCAWHDCDAIRKVFLRAVDGYAPSGPLMDRLWLRQLESSHHATPERSNETATCRRNGEVLNATEPVPVARVTSTIASAMSLRSVASEPERSGRLSPIDGATGRRHG
jgi:FlaA1/EpsC-like NDP-sugar epimerase